MTSLADIVLYALALPSVIWLACYAFPLVLNVVLPASPDLKKKYNAQWAVVTGGSSGIGRALCDALALQGFNIVMVAVDDELLNASHSALSNMFPTQEFRKVGALFAPDVDYMDAIEQATADIDVQCVFNNAGYMVTGFFHKTSLKSQLSNVECNFTATVKITHYFLGKMLAKNLKGCIVFTSSVSGYIPNPFAVMYGATKAAVSQFAASLAVECRAKGVDICAVHPSPVASNFFANLDHKIDALEMAKKTAVGPDSLPPMILPAPGRFIIRDMGGMALGVRAGIACLPYNALTMLFAVGAPFMPDYKRHND